MTQEATAIEERSLLSPEVVADPYSYFDELRTKDPVHWSGIHHSWLLTAYPDVDLALRSPRLSADRVAAMMRRRGQSLSDGAAPVYQILSRWMVFNDPPGHRRLRSVFDNAFTPRAMRSLSPRIVEVIDHLIDAVAPAGQMDVVHDFAYPLPAIVIAELIGVPASDRDIFKSWSDDVALLVFGALTMSDRHQVAQRSLVSLAAYMRDLVHQYQKQPGDNVVSRVLASGAIGTTVSEDELVGMLTHVLFAGHETTTNLIASGLRALLRNPEQLELLRANPQLMATAVDELLRYDGPAKLVVRAAAEDFELRGRSIRAGDRVFAVQAGANRDPDYFADPTRLDIRRSPNPHLGFGIGPHFCLGAGVARTEAQLALAALINRLPQLQLVPIKHRWHESLINRSLVELPVRFKS